MAEYAVDDILAEVGGGDATWTPVGAQSPELAVIPQNWRPIASASTSSERCRHALSLWGTDFTELLPGFARRFRDELSDVEGLSTTTG